jgi:hypothetical protein
VREYGERFPRGEIFGFEQDGRETQLFLRELELHARLPLYAYTFRRQGVEEGVSLDAVLIPAGPEAGGQIAVKRVKRPFNYAFPLSRARVSWWHVPAEIQAFDFSLLDRGAGE